MAGSIAIEEPMNVPGLEEKDETGVSWELEDLSTEMINSRKLSVKAILTFRVRSEALMDGEAVVEARETGSGNMEAQEDSPLQVRRQTMETAALKVRRKDTVRVRESITLPGNKPAMEQILWKSFDRRLAGFLLEEAGIEGSVHLKITHEQIASHLGTAREVVSRMLKYFRDEGMITLMRGAVELTDMEKLRRLSG